jgi:hypothetical protein
VEALCTVVRRGLGSRRCVVGVAIRSATRSGRGSASIGGCSERGYGVE